MNKENISHQEAQQFTNNKYKECKKILDLFLIKKYPKNKDHSDDISEIIYKIYINYNKFDSDKSKLSTWIINIANNYMIDKQRKVYPNHITYDSDLYHQSLNDNNKQSKEFIIKDYYNYLKDNLTTDEFNILKYKYIDGVSVKNIAIIYNKDIKYIYNRLDYIKKKIKKGAVNPF